MEEKGNSAPKFVDMTSPEDNQRNFGVSIEDYMEEERLYDVYAVEEDIKELEKIVELRKNKRKKDGGIKFDTCIVGAEPLEHLIERYKELENEVKDLQEDYDKLWRENCEIRIKLEENTVTKSKIKEKIEEIKNTGIDFAWEQINYSIREQDRARIEVLQELLEEE